MTYGFCHIIASGCLVIVGTRLISIVSKPIKIVVVVIIIVVVILVQKRWAQKRFVPKNFLNPYNFGAKKCGVQYWVEYCVEHWG